ncbi:MAG: NYN domain-containing protein [Anaerolineales bacterium]|nr:NYN domain-containing protein [Anaerolineales bacterium]
MALYDLIIFCFNTDVNEAGMKKLHAYIDGFNLYWGIMDRKNNMPNAKYPPAVLRKFLWLDMLKYISWFFDNTYALENIHYFTAPIRDNPSSLARQEAYWKALESIPHLHIHRGVNAQRYDQKGHFVKYEEKQSDVRFGLQVLEDVLTIPELEAIALVTADSDQIPTIEKVQALRPNIEIRLIYPPLRHSGDLEKLIAKPYKTNYRPLSACQFPETVSYERNGIEISTAKPPEWV